MSEDVIAYNRGELKFVRLKNIPDDLIGYVSYKDECIVIETPLRIEIETYFEEGRQILAMQEYLPQSVIELREIEIPMADVLFATPVRKEFYEQYEYVSDFFYNNTHNLNKPKKKKTNNKSIDEETEELQENVVSILEALAKKDKGPVH
jgi:hypothetical protein